MKKNFKKALALFVLTITVISIAGVFVSHFEQTNNNYNSQDPDFNEKNNNSEDSSTYYLVKSVDGQIKVFFINKSGEPLELETTQIVYELLSTADQKLFDEGCRVESQEELAVLLQDFES